MNIHHAFTLPCYRTCYGQGPTAVPGPAVAGSPSAPHQHRVTPAPLFHPAFKPVQPPKLQGCTAASHPDMGHQGGPQPNSCSTTVPTSGYKKQTSAGLGAPERPHERGAQRLPDLLTFLHPLQQHLLRLRILIHLQRQQRKAPHCINPVGCTSAPLSFHRNSQTHKSAAPRG